jgi:hypothetical protein
MDSAPEIAVQLSPSISSRNQFARYCINRIEGELGDDARWDVTIGLSSSDARTQIVLEQVGLTLETRSIGHDAELDVWDAMCRLEQMLRERRLLSQ